MVNKMNKFVYDDKFLFKTGCITVLNSRHDFVNCNYNEDLKAIMFKFDKHWTDYYYLNKKQLNDLYAWFKKMNFQKYIKSVEPKKFNEKLKKHITNEKPSDYICIPGWGRHTCVKNNSFLSFNYYPTNCTYGYTDEFEILELSEIEKILSLSSDAAFLLAYNFLSVLKYPLTRTGIFKNFSVALCTKNSDYSNKLAWLFCDNFCHNYLKDADIFKYFHSIDEPISKENEIEIEKEDEENSIKEVKLKNKYIKKFSLVHDCVRIFKEYTKSEEINAISKEYDHDNLANYGLPLFLLNTTRKKVNIDVFIPLENNSVRITNTKLNEYKEILFYIKESFIKDFYNKYSAKELELSELTKKNKLNLQSNNVININKIKSKYSMHEIYIREYIKSFGKTKSKDNYLFVDNDSYYIYLQLTFAIKLFLETLYSITYTYNVITEETERKLYDSIFKTMEKSGLTNKNHVKYQSENIKLLLETIDSYFKKKSRKNHLRKTGLDNNKKIDMVRVWYDDSHIIIKSDNVQQLLNVVSGKIIFNLKFKEQLAENGYIKRTINEKRNNSYEYSHHYEKTLFKGSKGREKYIFFERDKCKNFFKTIEALINEQNGVIVKTPEQHPMPLPEKENKSQKASLKYTIRPYHINDFQVSLNGNSYLLAPEVVATITYLVEYKKLDKSKIKYKYKYKYNYKEGKFPDEIVESITNQCLELLKNTKFCDSFECMNNLLSEIETQNYDPHKYFCLVIKSLYYKEYKNINDLRPDSEYADKNLLFPKDPMKRFLKEIQKM